MTKDQFTQIAKSQMKGNTTKHISKVLKEAAKHFYSDTDYNKKDSQTDKSET